MTQPFENPFSRQRPDGFAARISEIKTWTRTILALEEDAIVSVSELACSQPECPPKMVVVLVLCDPEPPRKFTVHKALLDTKEDDIREASSLIEIVTVHS